MERVVGRWDLVYVYWITSGTFDTPKSITRSSNQTQYILYMKIFIRYIYIRLRHGNRVGSGGQLNSRRVLRALHMLRRSRASRSRLWGFDEMSRCECGHEYKMRARQCDHMLFVWCGVHNNKANVKQGLTSCDMFVCLGFLRGWRGDLRLFGFNAYIRISI